MRPVVFGMIAALACLIATTDGALAQKAGKAKGPDAAQVKAELLAKGATLAAANKVTCTPTDVRIVGSLPSADKKTPVSVIEYSCQEGLGYVMVDATDATAHADDCIALSGPGVAASLACTLPGNANPASALQRFVTKAASKCEVDKARMMGMAATARVYEVSCKAGDGAVLLAPLASDLNGAVSTMSCNAAAASGRPCTLTTEEANLAPARALVAKSDKASCQVAKARFVMAATTGDYYEFSCADGSGFMLLSNDGQYVKTTACTLASGINGGCTLTDVKQAATEENALYTKLSKAAGFNCDVSKYGLFPAGGGGKEIVELACANRPDGAVAIFSGDSKGTVLNCGRSIAEGYKCSYTAIEIAQAAITDQLKAQNRASCKVNDLRSVGRTKDEAFLEVSCADGDPGWVLEYVLGVNEPKQILSCAQASNIGNGCQLKGNKKS
jgi:hypothetical protein